jgi:hypothetical protein
VEVERSTVTQELNQGGCGERTPLGGGADGREITFLFDKKIEGRR